MPSFRQLRSPPHRPRFCPLIRPRKWASPIADRGGGGGGGGAGFDEPSSRIKLHGLRRLFMQQACRFLNRRLNGWWKCKFVNMGLTSGCRVARVFLRTECIAIIVGGYYLDMPHSWAIIIHVEWEKSQIRSRLEDTKLALLLMRTGLNKLAKLAWLMTGYIIAELSEREKSKY